jgi:hypothetical protein
LIWSVEKNESVLKVLLTQKIDIRMLFQTPSIAASHIQCII